MIIEGVLLNEHRSFLQVIVVGTQVDLPRGISCGLLVEYLPRTLDFDTFKNAIHGRRDISNHPIDSKHHLPL